VEVDESWHDTPKMKARDSERMKRVIDVLNPSEVFRFSLTENKLQKIYWGFEILDWAI